MTPLFRAERPRPAQKLLGCLARYLIAVEEHLSYHEEVSELLLVQEKQ